MAQAYELGHVTVHDLAIGLKVSEATVRRDLRALAQQSQIEVTHGGAFVSRGSDYSFNSKLQRNVEAKKVIGKLAAGLITDGSQIFLDSGTTSYEMCPHLRPKRGLSVIINSVRIAQELASPGVSVIMLGGQYRPDRMDTVGPVATSSLEQLRGFTAFIGTDGIGMDFGMTASDIESAHLYRLAVRNARQTILLADHTKFDAPSLYMIVQWDSISHIVTDCQPNQQWRDFFAQREIQVIFPNHQ